LRPQLLHRRKLDCLDLPPKLRCFHPVPLAAAAERQFQRQLAERVEAYRRRAAAGLVRSDAEALALLTWLRRLAAQMAEQAANRELSNRLKRGSIGPEFFSNFGSSHR
jgi:hypothetical protein